MYAELAATYDLDYVPFIREGVAAGSRYMQNDGLHPNAQGQQVMAEYLGPKLQQFLLKGGKSGAGELRPK